MGVVNRTRLRPAYQSADFSGSPDGARSVGVAHRGSSHDADQPAESLSAFDDSVHVNVVDRRFVKLTDQTAHGAIRRGHASVNIAVAQCANQRTRQATDKAATPDVGANQSDVSD